MRKLRANTNERPSLSTGLGGTKETMLRERNCAEQSCGRASIASLNQRDLCLEHFLLFCYENLERLDPRGRSFSSHSVDLASMRAFIEDAPARRSTSVSIPRILIISNAAACWTSCSGPASYSFSCEPRGSPSTNLLHLLKARHFRGQLLSCRWIASHHEPSQKSDSPILSTARFRIPRDRNTPLARRAASTASTMSARR